MRLFAILAAAGLVMRSADAQPDSEIDFLPELEQRAAFEPSAFTAQFEVAVDTPAFKLSVHLLEQSPVLGTLPRDGQSQVLFELPPCGAIPPHVHPRATETLMMVEGAVLAGFIEENGGRVINSNLTMGDVFTMPQGLLHYHQNLACEPAKYFGVLDHRDPGTQTIVPNLLRAPLSILRGALGVDDETIAKLQAATMTLTIDPVCVARCNGGAGGSGGEPDDEDEGDDEDSGENSKSRERRERRPRED